LNFELAPSPQDFIWAGGIEDTFVPQTRARQRALDEYELMGHYEHWREDLALARDLDLQALRWGVPWYRVEPQQGQFDWSWTDQVLPYMVEELGITPIIDLMHYGTPFWLHREFDNEAYPQAVASYAAAFAERYRPLVRWYTPLNEPLVNADMCGRRGQWPPYLRGDAGYVRLVMQLVRGILATVAALKSADPSSVMVHVEASGMVRAASPDLGSLAQEDMRQLFLIYDLITGRVTPDHPLYNRLVRHGAPPADLAAFAREPLALDYMGLNFYPQWSTRELYLNDRGQMASRVTDRQGTVFAELISTYHARYGVPIIITETSAHGSDALRADWLDSSLAAIKALRAGGVPVVGYTWFPLFTMIDWRYRFGRAPVERYRLELGLYRLGEPGGPRWLATPLVQPFLGYRHNTEASVGPLAGKGRA
jgi:beta-glucosidase/6-phospho-beta-glucosidase/beta-galactosidase